MYYQHNDINKLYIIYQYCFLKLFRSMLMYSVSSIVQMSLYKFVLVEHFTLLIQVLKCCLQSARSVSIPFLSVLVLSVYLPLFSSAADDLCGRRDSCQQPQQNKPFSQDPCIIPREGLCVILLGLGVLPLRSVIFASRRECLISLGTWHLCYYNRGSDE